MSQTKKTISYKLDISITTKAKLSKFTFVDRFNREFETLPELITYLKSSYPNTLQEPLTTIDDDGNKIQVGYKFSFRANDTEEKKIDYRQDTVSIIKVEKVETFVDVNNTQVEIEGGETDE